MSAPVLSAATAFPPQADAEARSLAVDLLRQLAEAQRTFDAFRAKPMNAVEAEVLLSGPALFAEMLRDDIEDAIYGAWNHSASIRAAGLATARVLANPPAETFREAA